MRNRLVREFVPARRRAQEQNAPAHVSAAAKLARKYQTISKRRIEDARVFVRCHATQKNELARVIHTMKQREERVD